MHVPNGFLHDPVCALTTAAAAAALGTACYRLRQANQPGRAGESLSADLATAGALVFAAQLINVPVGAGVSGHLLGSAAAALVLGPWRALLVLASVIAVQAAAFGDGGLSTWGANTLNMGVVAIGAAWLCGSWANGRSRVALVAAGGLAGMVSVLAAALACSGELLLSGQGGASVVPTMLAIHLPIALGEGLFTAALMAALAGRTSLAVAPAPSAAASHSKRGWALAGAMALAALVAPWASAAPDGLEAVAERLGFAASASLSTAPLADYLMPGVAWMPLAVALAGVVGVGLAFAGSYAVSRLVRQPVAVKRSR